MPLILRTYVPAEGSDYTGGAGMPSVTLVMKDGSRLAGAQMCKAVNSPAPGSSERRLPTVVMGGDTYRQLVSGPGTPAGFPASGWDITSGDYDLRYWSMCTNESIVTTRYSDCVYDSNVVLDENRNFTIVVSKAGNRPSNPTKECGVTWLDWGEKGDGAGNPKSGHINIRNMLGDGFPHSIQNVSSTLSAEKDMGPYFPSTRYSSKAEFEARGCNTKGG